MVAEGEKRRRNTCQWNKTDTELKQTTAKRDEAQARALALDSEITNANESPR